ncbi:MAG: flagellar hook-associated protein FlgL, partial [uncultured bacterium]
MSISRVTFSTNILTIQDNLRRVQDSYNKAAIPATTGLRINSLSDDTSQISRMFSLRSLVADNEQYQKNIGNAKQFLGFTENRITQASDVLERIREILIRGNDASLTGAQREQLADQIAELKEEFVGHANAQIDNRYIFAGAKFTTQPFTGTPTTFNGNTTITVNQVTATLQMNTNLDGNELFIGNVDTAVSGDLATTLKDSDGVNLDLESGDTITVAGDIGGAFSSTFTLSSTNTLSDIASSLQTQIRAAGDGTETVTVQGDGSLQVTAGATAITNLTMSVTGKTAFNTAFTFPTTI